jgi:hypothetical protein
MNKNWIFTREEINEKNQLLATKESLLPNERRKILIFFEKKLASLCENRLPEKVKVKTPVDHK